STPFIKRLAAWLLQREETRMQADPLCKAARRIQSVATKIFTQVYPPQQLPRYRAGGGSVQHGPGKRKRRACGNVPLAVPPSCCSRLRWIC
uniref:Uncharacterized protein n=1 Tax=Varanus komodoensis TaxID=61221 RepID=A0A8D2J9P4_VARKO